MIMFGFHEKGQPCQVSREFRGSQPSFHSSSQSGPSCLTSERALSPYDLKGSAETSELRSSLYSLVDFGSVSPISAVLLFQATACRSRSGSYCVPSRKR